MPKTDRNDKYRSWAKGHACTLMLAGCNQDRETTVLHHIKVDGTGLKCPDWFGILVCSNCHAECHNDEENSVRPHPSEFEFLQVIALRLTLQLAMAEGIIDFDPKSLIAFRAVLQEAFTQGVLSWK